MSRRFLITLLTLIVIGVAAGVAIFLAKGYTFSPEQGRILGTGIISITSKPDSATVYIDGHLTTATDATIPSLAPKTYKVMLKKENFITWEKEVEVKEGLVTDLEVTLFPAIPTIYPLTYNGIKNPVLSPDASKLAFVVPVSTESASIRKKAGVWVWSMESDQPIAFARGSEPHQVSRSELIDYTDATLRWSPDSKELLATVGDNNYLLSEDNFNDDPRDITPILTQTLRSWDEDIEDKEAARVASIRDLTIRRTASSSGALKWSPDETKFLYSEQPAANKQAVDEISTAAGQDQPGEEGNRHFKVYDLIENKQYDIPQAKYTFWLADSTHIVLVEEGQISIMDYDGTNKATVYAGTFEDSLVVAWPDSSRLAFITSFPTPTAKVPNLYGINLK
jgi:hypothetical protein